jgi:hypothetical protein
MLHFSIQLTLKSKIMKFFRPFLLTLCIPMFAYFPAYSQFGIAIASRSATAPALRGGAASTTGWQAVGGSFLYPFKWRPSTGAFDKSFGLTAAAGLGYAYSEDFSLSLLANIGSSSIDVDPDDVKVGSLTQRDSKGAITFAASLLIQWRTIQIGASLGIDKLFDEKKYDWQYDNKPWISFGIGIFTRS